MSGNKKSRPAKTTHRIRGFILYVARLLVAFLLGFVAMWLKSREHSSSLAEAERQTSLARMENSLASAAIYAQRGDYEKARQAAVTSLLLCGQKQRMALIQASRRQK